MRQVHHEGHEGTFDIGRSTLVIRHAVLIADDTECRLNVRVFRGLRGSPSDLCVLRVLSRLVLLDNRQRGETPRVRGS